LGSGSAYGVAEFSEYFIALRSARQLLENLSMDFTVIIQLRSSWYGWVKNRVDRG